MDYSKFDIEELTRKVKAGEDLTREETIAYQVRVLKMTEEQAIIITDKQYVDLLGLD